MVQMCCDQMMSNRSSSARWAYRKSFTCSPVEPSGTMKSMASPLTCSPWPSWPPYVVSCGNAAHTAR